MGFLGRVEPSSTEPSPSSPVSFRDSNRFPATPGKVENCSQSVSFWGNTLVRVILVALVCPCSNHMGWWFCYSSKTWWPLLPSEPPLANMFIEADWYRSSWGNKNEHQGQGESFLKKNLHSLDPWFTERSGGYTWDVYS